MTGPDLWLAIARNGEADRSHLSEAHRAYMADLVARGVIFASGPTAPSDAAPSNGGVTVLRVATEAEARAILDAEPYIRNGVRSYELLRWSIRHGDVVAE